ncbi:MAG TPA: ribbon-helix-helix protein, CopG family [Vicinamibacterales bacterium]|nr:ribbon-helix-helix protein, CopG family [Vicinamibacterales bacterium]
MRTIIEVPADQLEGLEALCRRDDISRAEAIRRAIAAWLDQEGTGGERAFGLWQNAKATGLEYQEQRRGEWGARPPGVRSR